MQKQTRAQIIALKRADNLINKIYCRECSGIQIGVMDIGEVFKVGRKAIAEGADDTELAARIVAFVETLRKN